MLIAVNPLSWSKKLWSLIMGSVGKYFVWFLKSSHFPISAKTCIQTFLYFEINSTLSQAFSFFFISIFKEDGTILAGCQWRKFLFISHEQRTKINLKPYFIGIVDRNKLSKHDMSTFNQHSGIKVLLTHEGAKAWKGSTTKSLR